ncbi:MAG TPA: L,D-transpeptidase [Burkholderiaceae bacterium]|nr:L,D-transpeptidase [Burkholderiaceae bacterium]
MPRLATSMPSRPTIPLPALRTPILAILAAGCVALAPAHARTRAAEAPSPEVAQLVQRALAAQDNRGQAFAVVDKKHARVHVFAADGTLRGTSPVLLGLAKGDDSVPGIGERPMAQIRPHERTTPAGRFASEPGVNTHGEDIVWVDYDAAVSMHRVRTANKADRRLERLATPTIADNRISYGCINVPAAFYDGYIKPALGSTRGVVYVMPETESAERRFSFMRTPPSP